MSHINEDLTTVTRLLATHAQNVNASISQSRYDINVISETILRPVLQVALNLPSLKNLNSAKRNYPAIDLADDEARVCVQITATNRADKVKKTIKEFIQNRLHEKYDRLIIYIITQKQKSYPAPAIAREVNGEFDFDISRDILDFTDLSRIIGVLHVDQIHTIKDVLEANFSDGKFPVSSLDKEKNKESLYLNWLEIYPPSTVFSAVTKLSYLEVKAYLRIHTKQLTVDYVVYEGKLFTFRDLNDVDQPLSNVAVIDQGTIESFPVAEFSMIDENYLNILKNLLRRTIEQQLLPQRVILQHQTKEFIFMPIESGAVVRREKWIGKKTNTRTVYKQTPKRDKANETLGHTHFAFSIEFLSMAGTWFMTILPDWFISSDGYRKSTFGGNSIKMIKGKERNVHIFSHTRFITFYLKHLASDGLPVGFQQLRFGELVSISGVPKVKEDSWRSRDNQGAKLEDDTDLLEDGS